MRRLDRWFRRHYLVSALSALSALGAGACFIALAYVVLKLAPDWFAETDDLGPKDRGTARQGVRTAALALLAGALAMIGSIYTARTFALNRAGHLTDRFTKAIEQLGHNTVDVRLGAIVLERIARDSKDDHPQVVEVLTAYVREHAPRDTTANTEQGSRGSPPSDKPPEPPDMGAARTATRPRRLDTDVQAALTVLGRRGLKHEQPNSMRLDLANTDLPTARLVEAQLSGADLSGADLRGADLRGADLRGAYLIEANLIGTNLIGAYLGGANLRGADLSKADLGGAHLSEANLSGAYLSGAYLREADLREADLSNAYLRGANLSGANLRGAYLRGADLRGAYLRGADLRETDLRGADLRETDLGGADLSGAYLREADLRGAYLRGADLRGAYSGANLSTAKHNRRTVWPDGFDLADAGISTEDTGG